MKLMFRRCEARSAAARMISARLMSHLMVAGLFCGVGTGSMFAAMGFAEAGIAATSPSARVGTQTTLTAETHEVEGRTVAPLALAVAAEDGSVASGSVTVVDRGRAVAGAFLDASGKVTITMDGLTPGGHTLQAVYNGDPQHAGSQSESLGLQSLATTAPDFTLTISAPTMTIAAPGDSGQMTVTVTPVDGTDFTGFLSLSCSGPSITSGAPGGSALPYGVSCTYTPANLQVTSPTAAGAVSADLTIQTQAPSGAGAMNHRPQQLPESRSPLVLAILLPGIVGLGFLGRKRGLLQRSVLLLLLGAVSVLGTSACAARYKYFHHPPTYNPGTTPGKYTITITAQSSNGVTAVVHSDTLALTVN